MTSLNAPLSVQQLVERFSVKRPTSNFVRWETELHQLLCDSTSFLSENSQLTQRLWHINHDTDQIPLCTVCNKNTVNWNKKHHQYNLYCSCACSGRSAQVSLKRKRTMIERYDVPHYTQANDFNEKRIQTSRQAYGVDFPLQDQSIRHKIKKTCLSRYGDEQYTRTQDYKDKTLKTNRQRYGVDFVSHLKIPSDSLTKLQNRQWLYTQHIEHKQTLTYIGNLLDVDGTTVAEYCRLHGIDITRFETSMWEREISNFLATQHVTFIQNDRTLLGGKELDFYLPHHNLAIELCGLYWHADIHDRINKNYHALKHQKCRDVGVNLLTIYEDEWIHKPNIVLDTITHKLGLSDTKIYARVTHVRTVTSSEKTQFFDNHHIQGNGPGSVNLGLFYNDELVSCVSLIQHKNNNYVLNRFCSSCQVIGGFSKLLAYFKQHYLWNIITTFADLRWSEGEMYTNNGFVMSSTLPPDYRYIRGNKTHHKFNFRHKSLSKTLTNYDPALTEQENCDMHGILRIWDCGKKKFIMQNSDRNTKC